MWRPVGQRKIVNWAGWTALVFILSITLGVLILLYGIEFQRRAVHRPFLFGNPVLIAAAAAHCASVTVFAWLGAGLTRNLLTKAFCGNREEEARSDKHPLAVKRENLLLAYSTSLAALAPFWGGAVGYRVYRGGHVGTMILFLLLAFAPLPVAVRRAISARSQGWRQCGRSVVRIFIMLMVLPSVAIFQPAFDLGRKRLETDIGIHRLAQDCEKLYNDRARAGVSGWVEAPRGAMATIGRLKPTWVQLRKGLADGQHQGLRIELHGGLDHYGYIMSMDAPGGEWRLAWVDGGLGWDELLYSWPATASRIDSQQKGSAPQ